MLTQSIPVLNRDFSFILETFFLAAVVCVTWSTSNSRDLSPNNVLLFNKLVVENWDLGVAKVISANTTKQTRNKVTKAPETTDFMPPESLTDSPVYDASLDIFSFGGVGV